MAPALNSEIVPLSEVPPVDMTDFNPATPVVLIVDDEPMVANTLSLILKRAGFQILTAYNAENALRLARTTPPSLVISDVAMPGMNGVELAQILADTFPDCKILLFSGHATSGDLTQARAAGYDFPLLTKPVHPAVMLQHVASFLQKKSHAYAV